jgi:hypothetical protein
VEIRPNLSSPKLNEYFGLHFLGCCLFLAVCAVCRFETFTKDNKMLFRSVTSLAPTAQAASLASRGNIRNKHTLVLVRHGACHSAI